MIEFFLNHPYLTIWVSLFVMFYRAQYLGYVVDDREWYNYMKNFKETFKKKPTVRNFIKYIYNSLYGAGFFKDGRTEHLATIFLHGINCSFIYNMSGSLFGSLLYLINPINNQTTLWLNGRRYAVSILAVLLAWNFWWTAPFMAGFIAWLHISGIAMPLLFLWTPFWMCVPLVSGLFIFLNRNHIWNKIKGRKKDFISSNENHKITWKKGILYIKSIGFNFFNCILPLKPSMYHLFLEDFGHTEDANKKGYSINFEFLKGLIALGILCYLFTTPYAFWSFWFLIFISQWCNIYQVTMNSADRYCSLANIGLMIILAGHIQMLPNPYSYIIGSSLAVLYIMKYIPLFRAYINIDHYYKYHINLTPDAANPIFFYSKEFIARKDFHSAFAIVKDGLKYKPHNIKLILSFIECMIFMGKIEQALRGIDYAEKFIPIGEEEDCKNLFEAIRRQHWKTYMKLQGKTPDGKNIIHNNGKPFRK